MKNFKVLLDCDGFLSRFQQRALGIVERVTGRRYVEADVKEYDFCKALGLTTAEKKIVMDAISDQRGFALGMEVYDGAIEAVRSVREIAAVRIVTSPWDSNETWMSERTRWLRQNFGIPSNHVYHLSEKESVFGNVFVDDKVENVIAWHKAWPREMAVLWRNAHNQDAVTPEGVLSTGSYVSLVDAIERRAQAQGVLRGVS